MSFIIEDFLLENDELLKNESIFHVANGYLGIRGNFEEGYDKSFKTIRGTYLNAFHEVSKIHYGEKLHGFPDSKQNILNVIDAQTIELYINDERFSLFEGEVLKYKRSFNLREGYTLREIHWRSSRGHEFNIRIKRMASFKELELFLISYEVESINYDGAVKLSSRINGDVSNYSSEDDPRVSSDNVKALRVEDCFEHGAIATVTTRTMNSGLLAACSTYHRVSLAHEKEFGVSDVDIEARITANLEAGDKLSLDKFVIYTDSLRYEKPRQEGIDKCLELILRPASYYFDEQREYLKEFWESSDVIIEGNELLQQGVHYNLYQLLQSVGKDEHSNICAKGLSGEGYEGHYFWDTEIYMFPFFLLTNPNLAKNLLLYRHGILASARENARTLGHKKGALFPWRTITGSECSGYFPSGTAQYHINADIAYAFIKYYLVTGDIEFVKNHGAEVLFETSRLWLDTGYFDGSSFKLDAVTGPDEYTCIVNNNYYTNVMAGYNLKWAVKVYRRLKQEYRKELEGLSERLGLLESEVSEWERAYENMYVPYDEELDINPQDDSFLSKAVWDFENTPEDHYPLLLNYHPLLLYRYQVCKQADTVLAHFLLEDEVKFSTIKNSYDYYEKITTHDSSLSSCIFSIMASKVGYRDKAYDYFLESVRLDLDDTHGNTKDGIHTANMGGTYLAIIYGFAGLRIMDEGISFSPQLPKEWEGYSFTIRYRGRVIEVCINRKEASFKLISGDGLDICLYSGDEIIKLGYDNETNIVVKGLK